MNTNESTTEYLFKQEYKTSVFININGTITIEQDDSTGATELVCFGSKKRAVDVARAILRLSKIAAFEPNDEVQAD